MLLSSIGNWGYTYQAHQRFGKPPRKDAFDILDASYTKSEITLAECGQIDSEIAKV